ncbi:hypothetical protein TNCV_3147321 [Trichonephila clavipes]|nr:hypothetical protein TNCV_3147321 [Trichonephila clavipes]
MFDDQELLIGVSWRKGDYLGSRAKLGFVPQAGSFKGNVLGISQTLGNSPQCGGVRYATVVGLSPAATEDRTG